MGRLEGKVAIVTGGGQGIGRGIALAFAKEGAKVAVVDINGEMANAVRDELLAVGCGSVAIACDVSKEPQVKNTVEAAARELGPIDILVNNAARYGKRKPIEEIREEDWDIAFEVGPKGTMFCSRAVLPYMKERGGRIINFGSGAGIRGAEGSAAYNGAKEAIRAFTRTAAREWGKYHINVNTIVPSATSPSRAEWEQHHPVEAQALLAESMLGIAGDAEQDIGRAAVFLASDDGKFMTGTTLVIDGGRSLL